jgi:hypothetical protein
VIGLTGQPVERPDPKKPTTLRGVVGVWNCESSDYIRGRDGACYHAARFLVRSGRLGHNQCHGLSHFCPETSSFRLPFEAGVMDSTHLVSLSSAKEGAREGTIWRELVRELQKAFIVTVFGDQRGNQCKAAVRWARAIRIFG